VDSKLCYDCDEEIPAARLKAKPGVIRCVSCQTKHEDNDRTEPAPNTGYNFTRLGTRACVRPSSHQDVYMRKMATRGYFQTAV
jgi:hypothetical protein